MTRKFPGTNSDLCASSALDLSRPVFQCHQNHQLVSPGRTTPTDPSELSKSSFFFYLCFLHPHLYPLIFNLDTENVNDNQAAQAGSLLPPAKRRSGSNLFSHLISHGKPIRPPSCVPPAGSPADKRTLSRLNDKQFCDAEAVKCIRQVQGSLPNWCVRVSAIRGQVNSLGDCRGKADNGLGGRGQAGGPGGAPCSAPLARLSQCTWALAPSSHQTLAAPLPQLVRGTAKHKHAVRTCRSARETSLPK